ncbi:DNA starvation/stationary phase protection protein [bacterium]|nr:DNA starvation/stationary phase protection protein [bacterium]
MDSIDEQKFIPFPERTSGAVAQTPLALSLDYCEEMVSQLDKIVSGLATLAHLYQKHHWLVEGPEFGPLSREFAGNVTEVQQEVDTVAKRLIALGGIPTCRPSLQEEGSDVLMEHEGKFPVRNMIVRDVDCERALLLLVREAIRFSSFKSDYGTETLLRELLLQMERRIYQLSHYLRSDSLVER